MKKAPWKWLVVVLVSAAIWFAPVPWGISDQAWRLFALFFGAILAVLINATSILLSALLALIMAILTGVLTTEQAFSGFSESFMLLILAAFLLSKGVINSGLGSRIALHLIRRFGSSTLRLAYCIFVTDALLGPAIPSNTARSGILFPIVKSLALDTGSHPEKASRKRTGSFLMMSGIASLTISSALWLTAMAGNPIGARIAGEFGVEINFSLWFLAASLPCLFAIILLPYGLFRFFPPELKETPDAQQMAGNALKKRGAMSRREWITALTIAGMVVLWSLSGWLKLDLAVVALLGLSILMLTGIFSLEDLRKEGGDALETYIWFSILYVMSASLNELGFMSTLGIKISGALGDLNWMLSYVLLTILYVLIHYLFVGQTAQLLALYAVFLEVGTGAQVPVVLMAFTLSFATNYFSALTPQASSANVIFAGSGYLEGGEIYRNGALITFLNLLIFLLATPWFLWIAGYWG